MPIDFEIEIQLLYLVSELGLEFACFSACVSPNALLLELGLEFALFRVSPSAHSPEGLSSFVK